MVMVDMLPSRPVSTLISTRVRTWLELLLATQGEWAGLQFAAQAIFLTNRVCAGSQPLTSSPVLALTLQ